MNKLVLQDRYTKALALHGTMHACIAFYKDEELEAV